MTDTCLCVFTTPRCLRLLCSVGCSRNRRSSFAQFNPLSPVWLEATAGDVLGFSASILFLWFNLLLYIGKIHNADDLAPRSDIRKQHRVYLKTLTCKRQDNSCARSLQFLSSQREKSIRGRTQKAISTATAEGNGTKCNSGTRQFEKRRKRVKQEITEGDENEYSERLN